LKGLKLPTHLLTRQILSHSDYIPVQLKFRIFMLCPLIPLIVDHSTLMHNALSWKNSKILWELSSSQWRWWLLHDGQSCTLGNLHEIPGFIMCDSVVEKVCKVICYNKWAYHWCSWNCIAPASAFLYNMRCSNEVPRTILLQSYLYTYSLLIGVTFKVLPLSGYALCPMMLPLLQTFFEFLLWNSFPCRHHIRLDVINILKSSSL
jgi:hypothetical protein